MCGGNCIAQAAYTLIPGATVFNSGTFIYCGIFLVPVNPIGITLPASISGLATAIGMIPNSVPALPSYCATLNTAGAGPLNLIGLTSSLLPLLLDIRYSNAVRCAPPPTATLIGLVVVRINCANCSGVLISLRGLATKTNGLLPMVSTSVKLS